MKIRRFVEIAVVREVFGAGKMLLSRGWRFKARRGTGRYRGQARSHKLLAQPCLH
jgi:hypothetical protein